MTVGTVLWLVVLAWVVTALLSRRKYNKRKSEDQNRIIELETKNSLLRGQLRKTEENLLRWVEIECKIAHTLPLFEAIKQRFNEYKENNK